jgi:hypothetical protein
MRLFGPDPMIDPHICKSLLFEMLARFTQHF